MALTRASHSDGDPCWIELFTTDVDTARSFYGDLFGWTSTSTGPEFGGYVMFELDGEPIAGCMLNDAASGSTAPSMWSVYLQSPDVEGTVAEARTAGAQVVIEPRIVGDLGAMAMLVDPAGAAVGVWQPGNMTGIASRNDIGAPAWFETLSRDYGTAVPFYTKVFGWDSHTMSDSGEFRYTTLGEGEDARAGIMDARGYLDSIGDGLPSRWQFYIAVEDTDETVAEAIARGAELVMPAADSPYGRIAQMIDPSGVTFAVMGPNLEAA